MENRPPPSTADWPSLAQRLRRLVPGTPLSEAACAMLRDVATVLEAYCAHGPRDIVFEARGPWVLIHGRTERGTIWLERNLPEGTFRQEAPGCAVPVRYAATVADAAYTDG